ncbi:MAG: TlpA family protein disulfide reductase [Bacteroidetes bacterium]|nr:TlpA family protein disulfide reductase [Bacteroidota bacterium]
MKISSRSIFLLFLCVFNNAFSQNEFTKVTGYIEGAKDNDLVYIVSTKGYKDSAYVMKGEFTFMFNAEKWWDVYFISCPNVSKNFHFPIFFKLGSSIRLTINEALNKPIISGDEIAMEQNEFYKNLANISKPYYEIQERIANENTVNQSLSDSLKTVETSIKKFTVDWVKSHVSSPFSAAVIRLYIDQTNILQHADSVATKCFNLLTPQAKKDNYQAWLLSEQFALLDDKYSTIPTHGLAPSFKIYDTGGNLIKLSDYKGNWLLIDFWASWCMPCIENLPVLRAFEKKYNHEQKLKILSISVDTDKTKWKSAIKKHQMTWPQGTDLKGIGYGIAYAYQVSAIPLYVLISPEGYIVEKSLGGDITTIEPKLKEIFNNQSMQSH